jgi:hypothetical protein
MPDGKIITAYHALTCKLGIISPEFFITIRKLIDAMRSITETKIAMK